MALSDRHNHAGVFTVIIKSGPIWQDVKDIRFETNEIVLLSHRETSFYYWKVFICAILWYNYWFQVLWGIGRLVLEWGGWGLED